MIEMLVKPVLVLVVGYLLRLAFNAIGVPLDEAVFNSIVAGLVTWLLALAGLEGAQRGVRFFRKG